jgi:hypothetical protein
MDLDVLRDQYRGTTLPKLVEKQIRSFDEATTLKAIQGTFANFPAAHRPDLDTFTQDYLAERWFGPHIVKQDLAVLFSETIRDIQGMSEAKGYAFSSERAFDLFNIMVLKMAWFAHSRPDFRRDLGIKKGWFSSARGPG